MINVTKTYLPSLNDYSKLLEQIWQKGIITNNGDFTKLLESNIKNYLDVPFFSLVSNGTLALQLAIKAIGKTGEIITTPFSYVATTSSIAWENCTPVFADINPETFNISADKIESLISKNTIAILATHVFGNPCEVEKIQEIARKHNLIVIYDNAHGFGVKYRNASLSTYGDISTLSFHATKIFHTVEGGGISTNNQDFHSKFLYMRNFGHKGFEDFQGIGINAKISELNSAMGLLVLEKLDFLIEVRRNNSNIYKNELSVLNNKISFQKLQSHLEYNYAYFPILFSSEQQLMKVRDNLNKEEIFPRRYFYPSLSTLPYLEHESRNKVPVSMDIASRILCLPLYHDLDEKTVKKICSLIIQAHA